MEVGYVTTKGQLVIPSRLRKMFGIKDGTRVNFYPDHEGIKIVPITVETIENNIGFMKTEGKMLKALLDEKTREREL